MTAPGSCAKCQHGRSWHKISQSAARRRRRLGLPPTGNTPCTFPVPGKTGRHGSTACGCRDYREPGRLGSYVIVR